MNAIGVAEPGASLAADLRAALLHSEQHARLTAALFRAVHGYTCEAANDYDRRALIDGTRAKRFARIPVGRIAP